MVTIKQNTIFISAASREFKRYRQVLHARLRLPGQRIWVQEYFPPAGLATLEKLDRLIQASDLVLHLVGNSTGEAAHEVSVQVLEKQFPELAAQLPGGGVALSYTQWEAWLAHYRQRPLLIAQATDEARREADFVPNPAQMARQLEHLNYLEAAHHHVEICFSHDDELVEKVRACLLTYLPYIDPQEPRPNNLPGIDLEELFVGRDDDLKRLACHFAGPPLARQTARIVAIHGLGGVGKSRLAQEYAQRNEVDYQALLYVPAGDPSALERNLAGLCRPQVLDLPEQHEAEQTKQRDAVLAWLQRTPGWLLIIDGVDDETTADAAQTLAHGLQGGHVLITSRIADWGAGVEEIPLGELSAEWSEFFLLERTHGKRQQAADDGDRAAELARELGHLALALEQASAYIVKLRIGFAGYLKRWNEARRDALNWNQARITYYPESVATTWLTSFAQLTKPAQRLLHRLSWFAADPIPVSLLAVSVPDEPLRDYDLKTALADLASLCLAKVHRDANSFSVHALVQEVSRISQPAELASRTYFEAWHWMNRVFPANSSNVRTWETLDLVASHAISVVSRRPDDIDGQVDGRLPNQLALYLAAKGYIADARLQYEIAHRLEIAYYGASHPELAILKNNYGNFLRETGNYAEAEELLAAALKIAEKHHGRNDHLTAIVLNNLSLNLARLGKTSEAKQLANRALSIDKHIYGEKHEIIAHRLDNLAQRYQDENRLQEAEKLTRTALSISRARLGNAAPELPDILGNLGTILFETGEYDEAESCTTQAIELEEQYLGSKHPSLAIRYFNLAHIYRKKGRLVEAEKLFRDALAIDEEAYGTTHQFIIIRLSGLADLCNSRGNYSEAIRLVTRALDIAIKCLGDAHPETIQLTKDLKFFNSKGNQMSVENLLVKKINSLREGILNPNNAPASFSISQCSAMGILNMQLDAAINTLLNSNRNESDFEEALNDVIEVELAAKKVASE